MKDSTPKRFGRRRTALVAAGTAGLLAAAGALWYAPAASAATLFSDSFESGLASTWSHSGGTWATASDGSTVLQQSSTSADLAREFNGDTSWTDYTVQARVKPLAFDASSDYVGIAARASSNTTFYRLVLLGNNTVQLQNDKGGTVTVLGSASTTVSAGTWYTLRLDVSGNTITGYVNGTQVASGTGSLGTTGRIGLQTYQATANFDDVTVSSLGSTNPTSASPTSASPTPTGASPSPTTASPTPTSTGGGGGSSFALVGWATQNGGTTGGGSSTTVTVTSLSALTTAAASSTTEVIKVSGNFTCSADVTLTANKTILGVGSSSGLTGCGLKIKGIKNVIVRNMKISKVLAGNGNGDAIHIESSTNLWIDHNDLSSDTSHGTDYYDGLLDITHAADYITVSWNILHDHIKCSLVGHSDSNASEDTGHLRVTYHHNEFSNCAERNPRVRFGNPVHVYNNYYVNTQTFDYSYGIATTENAGVLVESNYFENITDPTHLSEGSSSGGNLVARNNYLVNSGAILTSGSVASIPYSYTVDTASSVKSIVTAGAGTGKI